MWFLFIVVIILFIIVVAKRSSDAERARQYRKQMKEFYANREQQQSNRPLADKNHYIIKRFMSQIDAVIGEEYLQYECVAKLRRETLEQLISAYNEAPEELTAFSDQIDHRLWALKQMCKLTLEEIGTGKYHLRDILNPEGHLLTKVNKRCLNQAYQHGYITNEELNQAIKELNEVIRETGEWA